MHFVDRKPKGEQPRLLTPHPDTSILYSSCPDGGTGRRKGLKIPRPYGCTSSILVPGTIKKQTGYDTNPHPFTFQNKPSHACSCNCKCKQETNAARNSAQFSAQFGTPCFALFPMLARHMHKSLGAFTDARRDEFKKKRIMDFAIPLQKGGSRLLPPFCLCRLDPFRRYPCVLG